jgi:putative two-component system response regulator
MSATKKTILVVDDVPDNIRLIIDLLKHKYTVLVANGGAKALEILGKVPVIDLVLLDIMMPDINGIEVMKQMAANPSWKKIPVVFLTADARGDTLWNGFDLGAKDYILKPIVPEILQVRVQEYLED